MNLDDKLADIYEIPFPAVILKYFLPSQFASSLFQITICRNALFAKTKFQELFEAYRAGKANEEM
jgi:hypothetical protein